MEVQKSKWVFRGKPLNEKIIVGFWGFTYKVTTPIGFYIGSKQFFSRTNPKISKKRANELYSGKGRKKTKELKIKESDWRDYITSSKKIQQMISESNPNDFKWEILELFNTKQEMLLKEAFLIAKEFLDRNSKILNEWISVKSFKLK